MCQIFGTLIADEQVRKIVFHPDRRICEAIQLVFAKFRELWSVRQTFQCAAVIGHLLRKFDPDGRVIARPFAASYIAIDLRRDQAAGN